MAIQVKAEFVFTEDSIEELDLVQLGDLFEKMMRSSGYVTEVLSANFELVNVDDGNCEDDE